MSKLVKGRNEDSDVVRESELEMSIGNDGVVANGSGDDIKVDVG